MQQYIWDYLLFLHLWNSITSTKDCPCVSNSLDCCYCRISTSEFAVGGWTLAQRTKRLWPTSGSLQWANGFAVGGPSHSDLHWSLFHLYFLGFLAIQWHQNYLYADQHLTRQEWLVSLMTNIGESRDNHMAELS